MDPNTKTYDILYSRQVILQQGSLKNGINIHIDQLCWQRQRYRLYVAAEDNPGRTVRPENGRFRVIPVILCKQYSDRKFFGFFPMISGRFLLESTGSWQKSTGKKSGQFSVGILLPRSSDFRCFPAGSGDFPAGSFGIRWSEASTWEYEN